MLIQPVSAGSAAISDISARTAAPRTHGPAMATANIADRASISQAARDRLAAEATEAAEAATTAGPGASSAVFDTNRGAITLDIDAYFQPPTGGFTELPPLMLPSANNIKALSDHVSTRMPDFLARNGIPVAPASIGYDQSGELQLPADYPYAKAFKAALAEDPALARSMQSVAAMSSVHADLQKSLPFQEAYRAASSAAEVARVVAKYAWLFADNRPSPNIALEFSTDGKLTVSADGAPVLRPGG